MSAFFAFSSPYADSKLKEGGIVHISIHVSTPLAVKMMPQARRVNGSRPRARSGPHARLCKHIYIRTFAISRRSEVARPQRTIIWSVLRYAGMQFAQMVCHFSNSARFGITVHLHCINTASGRAALMGLVAAARNWTSARPPDSCSRASGPSQFRRIGVYIPEPAARCRFLSP